MSQENVPFSTKFMGNGKTFFVLILILDNSWPLKTVLLVFVSTTQYINHISLLKSQSGLEDNNLMTS